MFGELETLRTRPIPNQDAMRQGRRGCRSWPIDSNDPRYFEESVDVRTLGIAGINHYHRTDNPPYNGSAPASISELYVRTGLVEPLQRVNERLKPAGLELFVFDTWRPTEVQAHMRDVWFPETLRKLHPDWSTERILEEVFKYWAEGPAHHVDVDPASPPPHTTGGVVDLTVRRMSGEHLWMGTIFDDLTDRAFTDALENRVAEWSFSEDEARGNRRLLYWLMTEVGFVVNPMEWWHFSLGDQMWAKLTSIQEGKDIAAFYSVIDLR